MCVCVVGMRVCVMYACAYAVNVHGFCVRVSVQCV